MVSMEIWGGVDVEGLLAMMVVVVLALGFGFGPR